MAMHNNPSSSFNFIISSANSFTKSLKAAEKSVKKSKGSADGAAVAVAVNAVAAQCVRILEKLGITVDPRHDTCECGSPAQAACDVCGESLDHLHVVCCECHNEAVDAFNDLLEEGTREDGLATAAPERVQASAATGDNFDLVAANDDDLLPATNAPTLRVAVNEATASNTDAESGEVTAEKDMGGKAGR